MSVPVNFGLVEGRLLDMINYEELDRTRARLELQTKLFLDGCSDRSLPAVRR
jgi:hypothetical protein